MRKRKIIRVGNSFDIRLNPSDLEDMGLCVGDFVDVEDIVKVKKQNKR